MQWGPELRHFRKLLWGRTSSVLQKPYELSFGRLSEFCSIWVFAEDEKGDIGLAEAVALPGYGWETTDTIACTVEKIIDSGSRAGESTLIELATRAYAENPFAASAIITALEMPRYVVARATGRYSLNAPVSGEVPIEQFRADVRRALELGFQYIKVKIGTSLSANIAAAHSILREFGDYEFQVVFDANQGFSLAAALKFAAALADCASQRLLWFEQPVNRSAWADMEALCCAGLAPILLDECIYDPNDIARAAALGAYGVKLKLFKHLGISGTLSLARQARAAGLAVVFGNGVATDIGNLGEYLVLSFGKGLFDAPIESNGYLKTNRSLLNVLGLGAGGQLIFSGDQNELRQAILAFVSNQTAGRLHA